MCHLLPSRKQKQTRRAQGRVPFKTVSLFLFSVKSTQQSNLRKEGVYFALDFQRDAAHHGREDGTVGRKNTVRSRKLGIHIVFTL